MTEHEYLATMSGLLGILTLGGLLILARDLRQLTRMVDRSLEVSEQILREVRKSE